MNQLNEISMDSKYSAICGFTEAELRGTFKPHIEQMAQTNQMNIEETYAKLATEYDGYDFTGDQIRVYNPFSLLNALDKTSFNHYWFETGTPTFLVKQMQHKYHILPDLENNISAEKKQLDVYRSGDHDVIPLLFQTGYLTIKSIKPISNTYVLGYPNNEVKYGFLDYFAKFITQDNDSQFSAAALVDDLLADKHQDFFDRLKAFYSDIPHDLSNKSETDFQTIFYITFTLLGQFVQVEKHTAIGSADAILQLPDRILIFEFKLDGSGTPESAIKQIRDRGYADSYIANPDEKRKIILFGVTFDNKKRTISDWKQEEL
jgi:hypothetical protein